MQTNYIRNKNYILRGSRCYGIPLDNTRLIYIRGVNSWSLENMRLFLKTHLKDQYNNILSVRRITNFNDNFFKIKVLANDDTIKIFTDIFKSTRQSISVTHFKCSNRNHKYSFSSLKKKLQFSSNSSSSSSINLNISTPSFSSNAPSNFECQLPSTDSNTHPQNCTNNCSNSCDHDNSFPFCLSWNTDGWNHNKRDSIEFFIAMYKPLFLCFQETGNGTGSNGHYPCRVCLPNYRYFFKKADDSIPGKRGLYLGYHKSCQASLDSSSFEYIISINTYSLWNNKKCSIGNIYVPQRRHKIFVKCAELEIISWLQSHSSNPSILVGDFNLSVDKLNDLISPLGNWMILRLNGSIISWSKGNHESAIDHAVINSSMMNLLSSGSFIDFPPISDHKPLLILGKSFSPDNSFSTPKMFVRWDRLKCIEKKDFIVNNNYFRLLESEIENSDSSMEELSKSFISTAFTIADELNITTEEEIRKSFFHISQCIFNLHKTKVLLFKEMKGAFFARILMNLKDLLLDIIDFV